MSSSLLPSWSPSSWVLQYILPKWEQYDVRAAIVRDALHNESVNVPGEMIIYCTKQERIIYPDAFLMPDDSFVRGETKQAAIAAFIDSLDAALDRLEQIRKKSRPWLKLTAQQRLNHEACDKIHAALASFRAGNRQCFTFAPLPPMPDAAPLPVGTTLFTLWDCIFKGEAHITEHAVSELSLYSEHADTVVACYALSDGRVLSLPLGVEDDGHPLPYGSSNMKLFLSRDSAESSAKGLLSKAFHALKGEPNTLR